jgi:hypothetical protein
MYNDFKNRLKERKLVEDSDSNLIKQLFGYKEELVLEEINKQPLKPLNVIENLKNKVSNKMENELKQKELSKKNKEEKFIQKKNFELYGKAEYDYEHKYEDKFYN